MNRKTSLFASWYKMAAFWCGSTMVAVGVALHFPMFWMGRKTGFRLVGMPMDRGMLVGMALIISGSLLPPMPAAARHQHERSATDRSRRPRTRRLRRPIGFR